MIVEAGCSQILQTPLGSCAEWGSPLSGDRGIYIGGNVWAVVQEYI